MFLSGGLAQLVTS